MTKKELLETWRNDVVDALTNTTHTYQQIAVQFGCTITTVYALAKARGIRRVADAKAVTNV